MATNGDRFAIACRPSRHNRLTAYLVSLVKVLCCGTMTADALSSMAVLKQVKGDRFARASLKDLGFTP